MENLIPSENFQLILIALLIFLARIIDVSINTIRIIFVMNGKKGLSAVLGFFESLVWLLAIGQIFQHVDNIYAYIAYPAGFAMGIFVGMKIEEKLALGKVIVRIITSEDMGKIVSYLQEGGFRYTIIAGETAEGEEKLLFTVLKREKLQLLLQQVKADLPNAFYTVESVRSASEAAVTEITRHRGINTWLRSVKRK